jgi:hypothetical protein
VHNRSRIYFFGELKKSRGLADPVLLSHERKQTSLLQSGERCPKRYLYDRQFVKTVLHFVHGFIELLEAMGILACGYLPAKMGFHFPRAHSRICASLRWRNIGSNARVSTVASAERPKQDSWYRFCNGEARRRPAMGTHDER